jgi:type VI secretion system protein VasJ
MAGSFYGWVEQGYARSCSNDGRQGRVLWRFWLRGLAREQLACGLICQSGDTIGRPYPLLLMGTGPLPGWEECWEDLPLACEGIWSAAEALSTDNPVTVAGLVQALDRLTCPVKILQDDTLPPVLPVTPLSGGIESEFGLYSLEAPNGSSIATAAAVRLGLMLKNRNSSPPVAIFVGGGETAYMAFIRRPLKPYDFEVLWDLRQH